MLYYVNPKKQPQYARITFELRTISQADLEAIAEHLGYRNLQEYAKAVFTARALADLDRIIAQREAVRNQAVVREVEAMLALPNPGELQDQWVLQETAA